MEFSTQLLCTFSSLAVYQRDIKSIYTDYNVAGDIYVLQNKNSLDEIFLTYNAERNTEKRHFKTISVHRKKEFNVIYSINALNELVKLEYGEIRKDLPIDWSHYQNSLIITNESGVKIIPTKLMTIFEL